MKRNLIALTVAALALFLCGCENFGQPQTDVIPSQMVSRIDISAEPEDTALERSYQQQEHLSPIIQMLRELNTGTEPEMSPDLCGEYTICSITVTYAGANTNHYDILNNRYLRVGDDDWQEPEYEKLTQLMDFIRDNPSE